MSFYAFTLAYHHNIHICVHACMHTYIHAYIYTGMHAYVHIMMNTNAARDKGPLAVILS